MTKQTNVVPFAEDFRIWLIKNSDKIIQENSAISTISRLNGLFTKVLDPAFDRITKSKNIRPFHEILEFLISNNIDKAIAAVSTITECAFDAKAKGQSIGTEESYNDRRSALNRYKEFLFNFPANNTIDTIELVILDKFIDKFEKKEFTKKELYNTIIFRRKTEDRLSGKVFYPIKLINKILNDNGSKKWINQWTEKIVDNIDIIISKDEKKCKFKDLADDKALEIESTHKVRVWFKDGTTAIVYTRNLDKEQPLKPLKLASLESMHIDHIVAISHLLKNGNYSALANLTVIINEAKCKYGIDKQYYAKIYSQYKNKLDILVEDIKKDLEKLSSNMGLEVMEGHINMKKSNK